MGRICLWGISGRENSVAVTTSGLVPDAAERAGNFSNEVNAAGQKMRGLQLGDGVALCGQRHACRISGAGTGFAEFVSVAEHSGNAQYNYQVPLVTDTHQDAVNSNVNKTIGRKNNI
jgi:hypothetical protein